MALRTITSERALRQNGKAPSYHSDGEFTITGSPVLDVTKIFRLDEYSAANAFVNGDLTVRGDLCTAIRFFRHEARDPLRQACFSVIGAIKDLTDSLRNGKEAAARNIRFHYDRSNDFYRLFLDSRMVYSAADFSCPECSLDDAQLQKMHRICLALDLSSGERFLDVGCGWGALVIHAAEHFGVNTTGCTLSHEQLEYARAMAKERGLAGQVTFKELDYRNLQGTFNKVASVGMFEHVGPRHLGEYFRKLDSLIADGGLFLNRGIVRPETASTGPATLFLQSRVFPGGGLAHLADVIREGERAGFEVLDMEDLREDYALTCHAWVSRLEANAEKCRNLVDEKTYRTWLLYLAASAVSFEDGETDAVQLTFRKRPS